MGQGDFGAHSEAKLVSQFMQTKFLCHKNSQNTPIFSVSYYRDCIILMEVSMAGKCHLFALEIFSNSSIQSLKYETDNIGVFWDFL